MRQHAPLTFLTRHGTGSMTGGVAPIPQDCTMTSPLETRMVTFSDLTSILTSRRGLRKKQSCRVMMYLFKAAGMALVGVQQANIECRHANKSSRF